MSKRYNKSQEENYMDFPSGISTRHKKYFFSGNKRPVTLRYLKEECIRLSLLILCLVVWSSWSQICGSKNGRKKCCVDYWYNHQMDQCLRCPDGNYGKNCSDVCPYPYFGELCRHKCNCSSAYCHPSGGCIPESTPGSTLCYGDNGETCCSNYWYKKESQKCVECNPGYFGINCMKKCPFPSYGVHCAHSCNCSVEDCNYATECSIQNIESNGTTSFNEKINEISQNRFYFRVVVFVFGGILIVFVIIFMWIELHQRTKRRLHEQNICAENVPVYDDIIINEEDGGVLISENEHL